MQLCHEEKGYVPGYSIRCVKHAVDTMNVILRRDMKKFEDNNRLCVVEILRSIVRLALLKTDKTVQKG